MSYNLIPFKVHNLKSATFAEGFWQGFELVVMEVNRVERLAVLDGGWDGLELVSRPVKLLIKREKI